MLLTYKAILRGNRIEWVGDAPDQSAQNGGSPVMITFLEAPAHPAKSDQGKRMAAALEKIAALPLNPALADPVAWQREMREDRALPGRED